MTARFQGIPVEAFEFYEALAAENTKAWWTAHKATYDTAVRGPIEDLLAELADEFGEGQMFRPYNDVRFSKDKTPYKDHQGAYVPTEDGIGYYVQVSAQRADGRRRLVVAVAASRSRATATPSTRATGVVLEKAIAAAEKAGLTLGGDVMKTRPRGVAEDHPRLDLLRHRTLTVERHDGTPAWVVDPQGAHPRAEDRGAR